MKNSKSSTNWVVGVIFVILGLFVVKYFNIAFPISVMTTTRSSEMAVVGEGKIEVTPDTAYVDAGITVDNKQTVEEVQKTISDINNKIIGAMKNIGIDKSDVKTSNYSVSPNYSYDNGQNKITGYNGNTTIEIKVRDPQLAAKVIEAATTAGANQIQGSRFVVDKPEIYREQVRNAAIQNAKDQAEKMAKSLGIKLGKITNIVESSPTDNTIVPYTAKTLSISSDQMGGGSNAVIEPGSQTITSEVTLYFEKN
jgi:uncharacterized protein YggE